MGETGHPCRTDAFHGSSIPEMDPRVPAGSARGQHAPSQARVCHRFPERQNHGRSRPAVPGGSRCPRRCPGEGIWERSGAGETHRDGEGKRTPRGTSEPQPLQEPEAILLKGSL